MWTTAGRTRSATLTNAACSASAVLIGDGAWGLGAGRVPDHSPCAQNPAPRQAKRALARRILRAVVGVIDSLGCRPDNCRESSAPEPKVSRKPLQICAFSLT